MCYILLSTCSAHSCYPPHRCTNILRMRYTQCSHAIIHSLDPTRCPNRMKRRRVSDQGECRMCQERRSSLSVLPRKSLVDSFAKLESLKRRLSSAVEERNGDEGRGTEGSADAMMVSVTPKFERRRSSTLPIYLCGEREDTPFRDSEAAAVTAETKNKKDTRNHKATMKSHRSTRAHRTSKLKRKYHYTNY